MIKTLQNTLKQDRDGFVLPKSVQDAIPIRRLWPDGIFQFGSKFSKTIRFTDINYAIASKEDKTSMFLGYSELLNALDTGSTTKITINNKRLNRQNFEQEILIPRQDDYLDGYRAEYNSMLMDKVTDSSNSVVQRLQHSVPPANPAQAVSEKRPHLRTEPPAIKTREALRQDVYAYVETALLDVESLVPDRRSPRSKLQEIRQIFRRRMSPPPRQRQEAASLQSLQPQIPSPEKAVKGTSPRQQAPAVKTKEACLRQQTVTPAESPVQARAQGGRVFVREQGRKEAVRRAAARRSRAKNDSAIQTSGEKGVLQGNAVGGSLQSSPSDIQAPTPSLQGREIPGPASSWTETPVTRAAKGVASKEKKAAKASRAGIKNSRQAVKAADRSAKAVRKSAQAAAKAPQRAVKAARATAKVGAATAREAAKASVSAIKGAIAAAQELIASLAAGGWAVVAVVLVLCMVGLLIASPFGLFFSGAEWNGSGVPQAVAQINGEFTARIEQIKEETPHDVLDLDNDAVAAVLDNWRNVLAVYAVRASTDGSSPSGLDGLTAENLALLREVFWDMNQISSFTETVPKGEDETEIVLHITATAKTPQEMAAEYGFTDDQKELLEELLKPEYQELFQTLIGSSQDLALSVEQVQEILDSLPDDLSEERRQVILTAYQLLGKVNYFWGGKSLVLGWDSRWGTPKEVWAVGSPSTGTVRPYGLDCSGFVDWVFYNISGGSYIIGHGGGAHMQHTYCDPISWDEAVPGDFCRRGCCTFQGNLLEHEPHNKRLIFGGTSCGSIWITFTETRRRSSASIGSPRPSSAASSPWRRPPSTA